MYLYVQISFDFPYTGLAFTWVYYSNIATTVILLPCMFMVLT